MLLRFANPCDPAHRIPHLHTANVELEDSFAEPSTQRGHFQGRPSYSRCTSCIPCPSKPFTATLDLTQLGEYATRSMPHPPFLSGNLTISCRRHQGSYQGLYPHLPLTTWQRLVHALGMSLLSHPTQQPLRPPRLRNLQTLIASSSPRPPRLRNLQTLRSLSKPPSSPTKPTSTKHRPNPPHPFTGIAHLRRQVVQPHDIVVVRHQ